VFFNQIAVALILCTTVLYNRQLRVKLAIIFGLAQTLAIPSGFGRSRIRRNCGYAVLPTVFSFRISHFEILS
jgi:hypothetical protein